MSSEYKYEVRGYLCQTKLRNGSHCEIGCDTLAEAKKKARFVITQQNALLCETETVLGYSQVVNRFTGEVVADYFNNGICQECGNLLPPADHCPCVKADLDYLEGKGTATVKNLTGTPTHS